MSQMSRRAAKVIPNENKGNYALLVNAEVTKLQARFCELSLKESELASTLSHMEKAFASKCAPFLSERKRIADEKKAVSDQLAKKLAPDPYPPARGPAFLAFVDTQWFNAVCNVVVALNIACMAFDSRLQAYHSMLYVLDQLFLVWYVLELAAKWQYHRNDLFFGSLSVVWWNWMDGGIVVAGVFDQWLLPPAKHVLPLPMLSFGWVRFLRFFRALRVMKVVKGFLLSDLSWTEETPFQVFMSGVIGVNSVVMSLELDYDWPGWNIFEQTFLVVYTFEIAVRLKRAGCKFFINDDLVWNNLDLVMVIGGAFNLWIMPAWSLIQKTLTGRAVEHSSGFTAFFKVLRIAKILRVLRLVRLLRMIKPLYELIIGVAEALEAMKWVLILTVLILYAGAIVFTSLIGRGYIYSSEKEVPDEAEQYFGSVPHSLFNLFKLMNGDTSVVEPICTDIKGRLLFAGFMIVSNWAVLAILTSVVSDNMLSSSQRIEEEDKQLKMEESFQARHNQLKQLFADVDRDKNGKVTKSEWHSLLQNAQLSDDLKDLTGFDDATLHEMFFILSEEGKRSPRDKDEPYLHFENFIDHINHDKDGADRRQLLHLRYWLEKVILNRVQSMEANLEDKFNDLRNMIRTGIASSRTEGGSHPSSAQNAFNPEPIHRRDGFDSAARPTLQSNLRHTLAHHPIQHDISLHTIGSNASSAYPHHTPANHVGLSSRDGVGLQ